MFCIFNELTNYKTGSQNMSMNNVAILNKLTFKLKRTWDRLLVHINYRIIPWHLFNRRYTSSATREAALALNKIALNERKRFRKRFISLCHSIKTNPGANLFDLALFKEALVKHLPVENAFSLVRIILAFPPTAQVKRRKVRSLLDAAKTEALFFYEFGSSGEEYTIHPCKIYGAGDHQAIQCKTRSFFVACLENATVRGLSSFIAYQEVELLDYEGSELQRAEERLASDPPVIQGNPEEIWVRSPDPADMSFQTAFTLLGPMSPQFGHWLWEYMPKYVAALNSFEIDHIPVLVDASIPATHLEFLRMMLPSTTKILKVPASASVRVANLWCAPRLQFLPVFPNNNNINRVPDRVAEPTRFAACVREMRRRLDLDASLTTGPAKIFLARKPGQSHELRNRAELEEYARSCGFAIIHSQDLDFKSQLALMQGARYIAGPSGSAMFLNFFASAGAKVCVLSSELTYRATTFTCLLEAIGIDVSVLTGPVAQIADVPHHAEYEIPLASFKTFIDDWVN